MRYLTTQLTLVSKEMEIGKKASALDVRKAHEEGIKIDTHLCESAYGNGFALGASFNKNGENFMFQGKRFAATTPEEANEEFKRKKERLLTGKSPRANAYSSEYKKAKAILEQKIADILENSEKSESNRILTTRITINKKAGEPIFKVSRLTSIEDLKKKYDPEYSAYMAAFRKEAQG